MKKKTAALVMLATLGSARAHADSIAHQISLSPTLGYSNFHGFVYGAKLEYARALTSRLQWDGAGQFLVEGAGSYYALSTGLTYNLSDDLARAYYVGAGAGYADFGRHEKFEASQAFYGYAKLGKRFALSSSGSFSWSPELFVNARSFERARIGVNLVQFTWSF